MEILATSLRNASRRGARIGAAALAALCLALSPVTVIAANSLEDWVKAAFLYKFGIYVEWPEKAFSSANSPINLCVAGEDPFGSLLDEAVKGQRIGDRAVVILRLQSVTRDSGCHILYIGEADAQRTSQIIESLRGSSVLTVTDAKRSQGGIGIINFVLKDNRVRFDIDKVAAQQNGITVSSKLLSLALNVKQRH